MVWRLEDAVTVLNKWKDDSAQVLCADLVVGQTGA
jgi:hypothetical protein